MSVARAVSRLSEKPRCAGETQCLRAALSGSMGIASPAEPVPVLRPLIMVCVHHDNGGSHAIMFVVISVFWQLIDCDTLRSAPLRSGSGGATCRISRACCRGSRWSPSLSWGWITRLGAWPGRCAPVYRRRVRALGDPDGEGETEAVSRGTELPGDRRDTEQQRANGAQRVSAAQRKLGSRTRQQMVVRAVRTGLVDGALRNLCLPRTGPEQLLGYREDLLLKTWPGRYGALRSFPYSGRAITRFSPSLPRTWRPRRWRLAPKM